MHIVVNAVGLRFSSFGANFIIKSFKTKVRGVIMDSRDKVANQLHDYKKNPKVCDPLDVQLDKQIELSSKLQKCSMSNGEITPKLVRKRIDGSDLEEDEKQKDVDDRLKEFVARFVTFYESSLKEYYDRLENKEGKPGKVAEFFNKVTEMGKCGTEDRASYQIGINVLQSVVSSLGSNHNRKELKKLIHQLYKFKKNPHQVREELVKSGVDIFRSFESQFVQVTPDDSWERAMTKLAHDAVNRAINYHKENTDEEFSADSITRGILLGQSKRYKHTSTNFSKFSKGHTLKDKNSNSWNSAKLFGKAGLVTITSNGAADKYYKKRDRRKFFASLFTRIIPPKNSTSKYGYRLLFNWESESVDLTAEYHEESQLMEEYTYILKPNEELESILLNKINNQEKTEEEKLFKSVEKYVKQIKQDTEDNFKKIEKGVSYIYGNLLNYLKKRENEIKEQLDTIVQQNEETSLQLEKIAIENKNEYEKAGQHREKIAAENKHEHEKASLERGKIENKVIQECEKIENKISQEGEKITIEIKNELENARAVIVENVRQEITGKGKQRRKEQKIINFDIRELVKPFIERKIEIGKVNAVIYQGTIVVIGGLDGVGKSELATNYAHQYSKEYNIIWINAATDATAKQSFRRLLKELGSTTKDSDEEEKSIESMAKEVYGHESFSGKTSLFIFDNAQKYNAVEKFLPLDLPNNANKFYILITSPNIIEWKCLRKTIKVQPLSDFTPTEAKEFIKTALEINNDSEDTDIENLAGSLCNFPLALQQAVAFIRDKREELMERGYDFKVKDCLEKYKQTPRMLLNVKLPADAHITPVLKTLEVLLDNIKDNREYGKQALDMLNIMAYLATFNIPEEIFLNKLANNDEEKLRPITRLLKKFSIISIVNLNNKVMLNIHGLVQQVVRLELKEENEEEKVLETTLILLKQHIKDRDSAESYIPHIISVWDHASKYDRLIKSFIVDDIDDKDAYTTYFHLIAQGSKYEIVESILYKIEQKYLNKLHKIINAENNKDKGVPLHNAALTGDKQIIKLLLEKDADINAKNNCNWTPLLLAAKNNHMDAIKTLLDKNADVNATTNQGNSSLHFATKNDNMKMVNILLNKNAKVNAETKDEYTPLHLAAENGNLEMIKTFLSKNAYVDAKTKEKLTTLHFAARNGHSDIVKTLLSKDANFNAETKNQFTPIHFAAKNNHLKTIKALLNKNVNLNVKTTAGFTALHLATKNGHLDIIIALLQKGANVNIQDKKYDFTPLHWAVHIKNIEVGIELLKDERIDVNAQTTKKNTALHLAAGNGMLKIVEALITKKADLNIKNTDGKTALDVAHEKNQTEVANYINSC